MYEEAEASESAESERKASLRRPLAWLFHKVEEAVRDIEYRWLNSFPSSDKHKKTLISLKQRIFTFLAYSRMSSPTA